MLRILDQMSKDQIQLDRQGRITLALCLRKSILLFNNNLPDVLQSCLESILLYLTQNRVIQESEYLTNHFTHFFLIPSKKGILGKFNLFYLHFCGTDNIEPWPLFSIFSKDVRETQCQCSAVLLGIVDQ